MIYLDFNASTPVDPRVLDAMLPYLGACYGNPSSAHSLGRTVKAAVEKAREQVALLLGAQADEIIFTSGGTEACNQVIKGVAYSKKDRGKHIITSAIEHPAIANPCRYLAGCGYEVTYIGVDSKGVVDPQSVIEEIRPDTVLISIMHANNEVGTIQPIAEIAEIAREGGIFMHTDAAQSCGKIRTRVNELGVDFLSIAGHKLYAPQGIGALFVRRGVEIEPLHHGAGHERGRRAGTEPVANIVGLGVACELAERFISEPAAETTSRSEGTGPRRNEGGKECIKTSKRKDGEHWNGCTELLVTLRDRLHAGLSQSVRGDAVLLGHPTLRLPNTLNLGFRGRIGAEILGACPDICASTGAACHSGRHERSVTLAAMNVPEEVAAGAIRFSLGRSTTEAEIDSAIEILAVATA